jgi:hypothetical protein
LKRFGKLGVAARECRGARWHLHVPATLWGGAMVVGFKPLLFYAVAVTPPWLAFADALRF